MLFRTIKRLIEMGMTDGIEEKIDVFYAAGKIDSVQYNELISML